MTTANPPTVAELLALDQEICHACDGNGTGTTDEFHRPRFCAQCGGLGMVKAESLDSARASEWDAATGKFDQA